MEALKDKRAQKSQRSHGAKLQKRSRGLRGRWQTLMETLVDTYQTPPHTVKVRVRAYPQRERNSRPFFLPHDADTRDPENNE